jgi:S-adenosylmethionine uptake transporter
VTSGAGLKPTARTTHECNSESEPARADRQPHDIVHVSSSDQPGQPDRAMGLMVIAMLLLPIIDAIAKSVGGEVSAGQITWSRFAFQSLFMAPLALRVRLPLLGPGLGIHAARGALLALATTLFFHSLNFLGLADAISIFFVEPLLLTGLSALLLGEKVGWRRTLAVMVGFAGALIVIRPGFSDVGWATWLPVGAAFCFALYLVLTRRSAVRDNPARMQFFAGVFGCLFMSAMLFLGHEFDIAILRPSMPEPMTWVWLAMLGLIATFGHLLVVHAFRLASAGLLAPFQYIELVGATAYGWWLFDELPDRFTVLGALVIVGSGLYVFHRERVVQNRPDS